MRVLASVLAILCVTQSSPLRAPAAQTTPAPAQQAASDAQDESTAKAHKILDEMIAALGGQAFLSYPDKEEEGRTYGFFRGEPEGGGTLFWRFWKWPDKDRFELTKQRDVVELFNGENAWEITYKGTAFQPKKDADAFMRRRAHSLELVTRVWLKDPGVMVFYEGQAMAEQKTTDKVTVLTPQNDSVTIYVDVFTHLPVKKSFSYRDPEYRDRDTDEEIWGNYRPVQGIATPFSYARKHNGDMTLQRFITSASYNQNLPDALFVPKQMPPGNLKK
jgi:hypothetical protein